MPRLRISSANVGANIVVKAAQKQLAAIELRGADAEAVKDPGKFDADVTAADDDHVGRRSVGRKKASFDVIACSEPGNFGTDRPAPDWPPRMYFAVIFLPSIATVCGSTTSAWPSMISDTGVAEKLSVNAVQPADFFVLVGDQLAQSTRRSPTVQP